MTTTSLLIAAIPPPTHRASGPVASGGADTAAGGGPAALGGTRRGARSRFAMLRRCFAQPLWRPSARAPCWRAGRATARNDSGTAGAADATQETTTTAGAQAAAGVRLQLVGRFDSPLYVTAPPGDRRRLMVVEQGGVIRVMRGGRSSTRRSSTSARASWRGGEQGLLGSPSRRTTRAAGASTSTTRDRDGRQRVVEYRRARADRADAGSARAVLVMDDPESNHNGGQIAVRARRPALHRHRRRRRRRRPARQRGNAQHLGSPLGKILRIDPRAAGGRPTRSRPPTRSSAARGARRDLLATACATPGASRSTARPATSSIGDVGQDARRGDRLRRARRSGAGRELRLAAVGGRRAQLRREPAPARGRPGDREVARRRLVLDHRRLRRSRPAAARAPRALRLRRLLPRPDAQRAAVAPAGDAATGRWPCRACRTSRRSARTPRGRVYVVSLGGPVLPARRALTPAAAGVACARGRALATASAERALEAAARRAPARGRWRSRGVRHHLRRRRRRRRSAPAVGERADRQRVAVEQRDRGPGRASAAAPEQLELIAGPGTLETITLKRAARAAARATLAGPRAAARRRRAAARRSRRPRRSACGPASAHGPPQHA